VTFLEGNSSVAFYYLSASEIWPGKKGGGEVLVGGLDLIRG